MRYPDKPKTSIPPQLGETRYTHNVLVHLVTDIGNWMPQGEGYPDPILWGSGHSGYARTIVEGRLWHYCTALEDLLTRDEYDSYRRSLAAWHHSNADHYAKVSKDERTLAKRLERPLP